MTFGYSTWVMILLVRSVFMYKENFYGSKLGSDKYNMEMSVINYGKVDYIHAQNFTSNRSKLLCVTFASAIENPGILKYNVNHMNGYCEWAVILYTGSDQEVKSFCNDAGIAPHLRHCARAPCTLVNRTFTSPDGSVALPLSVPKTALYPEILYLLPSYQRVALFDADILLKGFDVNRFFKTWNCAFYPNPLIVQPLISESNQYLPFVNEKTWKKNTRKSIIISATGLVEQQVPFFDSLFFEWFVKRVLSLTIEYSLNYGVDWGHDRSWCNAAKLYAREILSWDLNTSVPCALITTTRTSVHHLNTKSMASKKLNREQFKENGRVVVQQYINLFPTWVITDLLGQSNPVSGKYGKSFRKAKKLNESLGNCNSGF